MADDQCLYFNAGSAFLGSDLDFRTGTLFGGRIPRSFFLLLDLRLSAFLAAGVAIAQGQVVELAAEFNSFSTANVGGVAQAAGEGFRQDSIGVGLDGADGDLQFARDFFVGFPLVVERQDLLLGGREWHHGNFIC